MTEQHSGYQKIYDKAAQWLKEVREHEGNSMVDLVNSIKSYLVAAEELTEDEIERSIYGLRRDLNQFYLHSQDEVNNSIYLTAIKEKFWQALAQITDKSKVEWAELVEDFEHNGVYNEGELVGFGQLICTRCHYRIDIVHPSRLGTCPECGHHQFKRQGLAP